MLSKKALGAAAAQESLFIEDVFSTWLRTGTGADVTVTNNIDMTEGYLLWTKSRSAATDHAVYDSGRGVTKDLATNSTAAETTQSTGLKAVSGTGYTIGSLAKMNTSSATYVDWVFRKAPKFFDVVTYTGNGVAGRTVAHNLGSVPGMIIVKRTDASSAWSVYHRSLGATQVIFLSSTSAAATVSSYWNNTAPTSTDFTLGDAGVTNGASAQYVAYLFAHDAGGFGEAGDQNVVSCGSFTTDGSAAATVNLGYEPQYVLIKGTSGGTWFIQDVMRGFSLTQATYLRAPSSSAETNVYGEYIFPTATGFSSLGSWFDPSTTYIYLAIRRGPMKTPTVGTSVFAPVTYTGDGTAGRVITTNILTDMAIYTARSSKTTNDANNRLNDRLREFNYLSTNLTNTESSVNEGIQSFSYMNAVRMNNQDNLNTIPYVMWSFRRAPGFFDVVCYTGTGVARTVNHNLGVAPELMIVKRRDTTGAWNVYSQAESATEVAFLNLTNAFAAGSQFNNTTPTSSVFSVGTSAALNASGGTYVAYLFATVPNVSKVFSYTGNGSSQTINCGFTTGARFVLIKRTDSTGNWVTFDTARGIIAGNDPALYLNSTAAEVTGVDGIDPDSSGFIVNQEGTFNLNVTSATYIGLAIA